MPQQVHSATKNIRKTTVKRHEIVRQKVNEYFTKTIDGIRLDFESIVAKVAEDTGYTPRYVRDILKG